METEAAPDRSLLARQEDVPFSFLGNFEPTPENRVNPNLELGLAISGGHLDFLKILLDAAESEMQLEDLKAFREYAYKHATTNQNEITSLLQDAIARTSMRMVKEKPKEVDIVKLSDDGEVIPLGTSSDVAAQLTKLIPDLEWHTEPGLMTQIEQNPNHPFRGLSERWDEETKSRFSEPSRKATLEHPDFSLHSTDSKKCRSTNCTSKFVATLIQRTCFFIYAGNATGNSSNSGCLREFAFTARKTGNNARAIQARRASE